MISLQKVKTLPRIQRLRKIEKLMAESDRRAAGALPPSGNTSLELELLASLAAFLAEDSEFDAYERQLCREAAAELTAAHQSYAQVLPRRPINAIRHMLARTVGKQIADWDLVDDTGKLSDRDRRIFPGMDVYLEDIRSPFNVGSIFRSSESFGVEEILLSPLCASPEHSRAVRSSMGCTELVRWRVQDIAGLELPVFALETGGTPMDEFRFPTRGIMVLGSEELGVSAGLLERADRSLGRLSIPLYGAKGSLNVAVACGIALRAWAEAILSGSCADSPA